MSDAVTPSSVRSLRELVLAYLQIHHELRQYNISGTTEYAEFLFELSMAGKRAVRGTRGYDLIAPRFGRVQVKCRVLPADGRIEERMHCKNVEDEFDHLGAVVFNNDLTVRQAVVATRDDVVRLIGECRDPEKKIAFKRFLKLSHSVDFTDRLRNALRDTAGLLPSEVPKHADADLLT